MSPAKHAFPQVNHHFHITRRTNSCGTPALVVDGIYGDNSKQACRELQGAAGLVVDGIVGPNTWQATWTAPLPSPAGAGDVDGRVPMPRGDAADLQGATGG